MHCIAGNSDADSCYTTHHLSARFHSTLNDHQALLSGTSIDRMLMHPADDEERGGLGWNVWEHEAHGRILSRVGGQSGASSLLVSYADRGVTVALLTNLARLDSIWTLTNDLIGMGLTTRAARARLIESE